MTSRKRPPDWDDLQAFLAIAERGSVAKAATWLGIDASTVLRRIGSLERTLDCRLFERLREGSALTASGAALAHRLRGMQYRVDAAHRRALGIEDSVEGTVRLSASDVVVESLLMPMLAAFRARHPAIRIEVASGYAFSTLASSEGDIAVRGADRAPERLVARGVGAIETVLCASPSYLATTPADRPLKEHRWVTLGESMTFERQRAWFQARIGTREVAMRVDSIVGVADAVAAGIGIAYMPHSLAMARGLTVLEGPVEGMHKPLWVAMHPDAAHAARVRALFAFLVDALRASPLLAHAPDSAAIRRRSTR
jgi:DNA-binding transcriptional LysR family regulator